MMTGIDTILAENSKQVPRDRQTRPGTGVSKKLDTRGPRSPASKVVKHKPP